PSPATAAGTTASVALSGARSMAATPAIVAGATTGPASTFAATETTLIDSESTATTGITGSCATIGIANAVASHRGNRVDSASIQVGPSTRMPAVASTDRAN